jgi:hypothetical protein
MMLWPMFNSTRCGTRMQRRQIFVIQSVPGVHLQAERVRLLRAGNQPLQFREAPGTARCAVSSPAR